MKIKTLAPWYGGNRMLAAEVGKALAGCEWVGIPFAGGMAEIPLIRARTIVANDLHRGVMSLAAYVREDCEGLQQVLRTLLFHPDTLLEAQEILRAEGFESTNRVAIAYFVCAWMTRSGSAGTDAELTSKVALRWEAGGGDSAKRYQSAIDSLGAWAVELRRCTFSMLDCFEFFDKCKDRERHGIYCDPPFPGPGDKYTHKFDEGRHRRLAERLSQFRHVRVVCRFYDHPLIRELYPEGDWKWLRFTGRNQANNATPEVLVVREQR